MMNYMIGHGLLYYRWENDKLYFMLVQVECRLQWMCKIYQSNENIWKIVVQGIDTQMNIRSKRGTFYILQDSVGGETEAVLGKYKHGLSQ